MLVSASAGGAEGLRQGATGADTTAAPATPTSSVGQPVVTLVWQPEL